MELSKSAIASIREAISKKLYELKFIPCLEHLTYFNPKEGYMVIRLPQIYWTAKIQTMKLQLNTVIDILTREIHEYILLQTISSHCCKRYSLSTQFKHKENSMTTTFFIDITLICGFNDNKPLHELL